MNRRTFLNSAVGAGTLAGMYGSLKGAAPDQAVTAAQEESQHAWGVNAIVLKSPWSDSPSLDELLADREHTVALDRFYRAGGDDRPSAPTECKIARNQHALFVVFRCGERDMPFPVGLRKEDWYSLPGLPSGSDSWPPFPDEVDLLLQPDMGKPSCYQFAVTPDGSKFGCERLLGSTPDQSGDKSARASRHATKLNQFEAIVVKGKNEWAAFFQIPWETLGGKPESSFGFLPMRTRWSDGEFTSPVAIDFYECLPVDLLVEVHFEGTAQIQGARNSLCRLPSGIVRWQRPAVLSYPPIATLRQVWQMESSLSAPTDMHNLARRLYLTQRWTDLLRLEGFTFQHATGSIVKRDMEPAIFRQRINAVLRSNEPERACPLLDAYLRKLDAVSRDWFADGSPGNILKEEWEPITSLDSLEVKNNLLLMRCATGSHKVDLHLALPKAGGVRIFTSDEGYIEPDGLLPLKASRSRQSCVVTTKNGGITIHTKPFSISFQDVAGDEVIRIGSDSLAFQFDSNGKIHAVDFTNRLASTEVIYGFGERYDRFDKRGSVLTLWGMDDWRGNGMGLRNTTYKPLPIFHSSKGCMVFNNSSYRLRADIGRSNPNQYRLTQQGPVFDYYFWIDSPERALQSYTALTGRPILPPKWAFEQWMGRGGYAWRSGPLHDAVAQEESVTKHFAELDIPHSAIYAEGRSAFSPALHQFMAARGIEVLGYFMPAVRQARQESLLPEVKLDELPILHCRTESETRDLGYVDFTNPKALELCKRWWKQGLELGVAGSMVDYGDRVPEDAVFYNGQHGDEMHNFYYHDYQRTISEVFREKRGGDFILFARGAAPGTQKWVGQFAGDHPSNFDGLKAVLTGALNLCACGFSTWGSDLGGYFGVPEPAVYIRWTQFGLFSPLMRWHGKAPREPWHYGEAAVANYKFCAWVRESLLNYIYNSAIIAHETGIPIMRSMAVAFPEERPLAAVRDQYMFGEDLLVAPVIDEHNFRTVLFPSGIWTGLWDGKVVSGPADLESSVPLDRIPVYLRQGAVVPVQLNRDLQFGKSMTDGRVDALVATLPNGNENVSRRNTRNEVANVAVRSTAHGFSWTLENFPEMNCLLVYGTTHASTVKVDGSVLSKVTETQFKSPPTGWESDPAGNRLIVRLPPIQAGPNSSTRSIEVDFDPTDK